MRLVIPQRRKMKNLVMVIEGEKNEEMSETRPKTYYQDLSHGIRYGQNRVNPKRE